MLRASMPWALSTWVAPIWASVRSQATSADGPGCGRLTSRVNRRAFLSPSIRFKEESHPIIQIMPKPTFNTNTIKMPRGDFSMLFPTYTNHKPTASATMQSILLRLSLWSLVSIIILYSIVDAESHMDGSILQRHHRGYNFHRSLRWLPPQQHRTGWNSLFEQQRQQLSRLPRTSTPPYRIVDNETNMTLEVELPGVTSDDLTVQLVEGDVLRIHGTRQPASSATSNPSTLEFDMSFDLENNINAGAVTATLSHGVLRVEVPKRTPAILRLPILTSEDSTSINGPEKLAAGTASGLETVKD